MKGDQAQAELSKRISTHFTTYGEKKKNVSFTRTNVRVRVKLTFVSFF